MPPGVFLVRRFLCENLGAVGEIVVLSDERSHHVLRVTGIAPGEEVELFDGLGGACRARLDGVEGGRAHLQVVELVATPPIESNVHLVLAQTRASVMDTVIRMVTEIGVEAITVVHTERCVAKGDKHERWTRIAEAASAQSGRSNVPTIGPPIPLNQALMAMGGRRFVCTPGSVVRARPSGPVTILVGPEGGLTEGEVDQAETAGWVRAGLGETVLRADTAAVASLVRYG